LGLVTLAACQDTPTNPPEEQPDEFARPALTAAFQGPTFTCTKTWASGISGLWEDPSRWSPAGVPGPADNACITAAGTYTVSLLTGVSVSDLRIGSRGTATVTVEFDALFGAEIRTSGYFIVEEGSTLTVWSQGEAALGVEPASELFNYGTIEIENSCACGGRVAYLQFGDIMNWGRLELTAPTTIQMGGLPAGEFDNLGTVATSIGAGPGTIEVWDGDWNQSYRGAVTGTAEVHLTSAGAGAGGDLVWIGGTLTGSPLSMMHVVGGDLILGDTLLVGTVQTSTPIVGSFNTIQGDIGSGVHLNATILTNDSVVFRTNGPGPLVNRGYLVLSPNETVGASFPDFVNEGTLVVQGVLGQPFDVTTPSFTNAGFFQPRFPTVRFVTPNATVRNSGDASGYGGAIEMTPGTRLILSGGDLDVPVHLDGATLRGSGRIGPVTTTAATIDPIGTLTAESLVLDANTELVMDILDSKNSDAVVVSTDVTYGGTLRIKQPPWVTLGTCGDVVSLIQDHSTGPRGTFATFAGLSPAPRNRWRVYNPVGSLQLAGYRTVRGATQVTQSAFALSEGGGPGAYHVCLGPTPPTADVTLSLTPQYGQLTAPGPLEFPLTSWMLPQAVTVRAVDDAVVEPTHADTITQTLSSADPNYQGLSPTVVTASITDNDGNTDLELDIQTAPTAVTVGTPFDVRYIVTNHGPTLATGATFTTPPLGTVGLSFVGGDDADCSVNGSGVVTCLIDAIAAGAQRGFWVTYDPTAAGPIALTGTARSQQPDPNAANDQATLNVTAN